jgi:hypothetical protein
MEQRRLRLGDIVDDYCPRERRVTNHAVVAMVEEDVKQTRCTTCDAEHAYKGGSAPRRRRKESPDSLYKEVLAGIADPEGTPVLAAPQPTLPALDEVSPAPAQPVNGSSQVSSPEAGEELATDPPAAEEGPVHRPLIRATLPRIEGQKDARPNPEFTIRQSNGRPNGNFRSDNRGDQRGRARGANGQHSNRPQGGSGGQRFQGSRAGNGSRAVPGRGQGGGFRNAQGQQRRSGGGRKRSR